MTEYDEDGKPVSRTMFSADRQLGEKQPLDRNLPPLSRPWYQRLTMARSLIRREV
jgi:hypothetical protein